MNLKILQYSKHHFSIFQTINLRTFMIVYSLELVFPTFSKYFFQNYYFPKLAFYKTRSYPEYLFIKRNNECENRKLGNPKLGSPKLGELDTFRILGNQAEQAPQGG